MVTRTIRWLLFCVFVLTVPLPMLGPWEVLAPTARYLLLAVVTAAVMAVEGAAGPVPLIFTLFAGHALLYLLLSWLAARLCTRLVNRLPAHARTGVVVAACAALLLIALMFDLYITPFGGLPHSNLLGLLS
ncbi:MAG: hypothetical protein H8E45_06375 [Proteobacteria bacterium]|nr:hypothetical protein [Pseudomonadota bacterium]